MNYRVHKMRTMMKFRNEMVDIFPHSFICVWQLTHLYSHTITTITLLSFLPLTSTATLSLPSLFSPFSHSPLQPHYHYHHSSLLSPTHLYSHTITTITLLSFLLLTSTATLSLPSSLFSPLSHSPLQPHYHYHHSSLPAPT